MSAFYGNKNVFDFKIATFIKHEQCKYGWNTRMAETMY